MIYKNWVVYLIKVMMIIASWEQWLQPTSQDVLFLNLVLLSSLNQGVAHFKRILTQVLLSACFLSLTHITFLLHPSPLQPLSPQRLWEPIILPGFSTASHIALKCILVQLRILPECHRFMSLAIYKWIILQDSLLSFSLLSNENKKNTSFPFFILSFRCSFDDDPSLISFKRFSDVLLYFTLAPSSPPLPPPL